MSIERPGFEPTPIEEGKKIQLEKLEKDIEAKMARANSLRHIAEEKLKSKKQTLEEEITKPPEKKMLSSWLFCKAM